MARQSFHPKASRRPAPIKHSFARFAGEYCPACGKNRLVAVLQYPVCIRCRKNYDISEKLLKSLKDHCLIITQEEIDWTEKPHPVLSGTIDDMSWKALFVMNKWQIAIPAATKEREILCSLIREYLEKMTPAWLERVKNKKTKIRRYFFFVAVGTTIVTAAYFIQKRAERLRKEKQEAEEAEKKIEKTHMPRL